MLETYARSKVLVHMSNVALFGQRWVMFVKEQVLLN